jgi:hypothetical protein
MFAMNQAVAHGFVFGKDIVFTFGPYSSIYTELYDPATDNLMIFGSLFLGLCYGFQLLLLAKGKPKYGLLLYGIFLACLMDSRDALLFSYPFVLSLVVYRMTLPDDHEWKLHLENSFRYGVVLLFAPLGLLPLIKGSLLPMCGMTAFLCLVIFWLNDQKILACTAVGVPAISCAVLWRISRQPLLALPGFFWNMRQIISGYTEAMSFPGNSGECVLYILAAVLIIFAIVWTTRAPRISTWFLSISYAFFLFLAFKSGFIRHDPWHNIIAGTSILTAALLLTFVSNAKSSILPIAVALMVWIYIGHGTVQTTADDISLNLRVTFGRTFHGAGARLFAKDDLHKLYDKQIATIHAAFPIPQMPGTMDIYSFNQAWVLASGNAWSPRPVTQSYSAYTPELTELNLRHLEGASAPDNIVFRVEPIDGRLPSLEDGVSWPAIINHYSFQELDRDSAYLRKRTNNIENVSTEAGAFYSAVHEFEEEVTLPDSSDPLFARLEITPTFTGKIWSALFKPPELHIAMHTRDGKKTSYRVISGMMKTDFLITPLIRNTEEFVLLAADGTKYLTGNEVKSISISADDRPGLLWNTTYSMRLRKLNLLKNTDTENSRLFEKMDESLTSRHSNSPTQACEGSIESVNGIAPRFGIPTIGNSLSIKGWLAVSGKDGIVPDHTYVTLTDENGKIIYIQTHSIARDDIRGHFNQPSMPDAGYAAIVDVSSLNGRYTLGLARTHKENTQTCQQFSWPIQIVQ